MNKHQETTTTIFRPTFTRLARQSVAKEIQASKEIQVSKEVQAPTDHYRVHIGYEPIPSYLELERLFPGEVDGFWDSSKFKVEAHESCRNADQTPGEKEFWLRGHRDRAWSDAVISDADKEGFRPATLMEMLAFLATHPELQLMYGIVSFGSFVVNGGVRYVPFTNPIDDRSNLFGGQYRGEWYGGFRFLLIRK